MGREATAEEVVEAFAEAVEALKNTAEDAGVTVVWTSLTFEEEQDFATNLSHWTNVADNLVVKLEVSAE